MRMGQRGMVALAVLSLAGCMCRGTAPGTAPSAGSGMAPSAGGSAPGGSSTTQARCAPVEGRLAAGTRADGLAGEFRLTLVATGGARAGQSASGALRLQAYGARAAPLEAPAGTRFPLFGGTDLDIAAVGAVAPGDVSRADAARPGVLVIESGTSDILLRLGADANQPGLQRFDGAFLALTVTSISAERFAGTWRSGGGNEQASGHFCADRVSR